MHHLLEDIKAGDNTRLAIATFPLGALQLEKTLTEKVSR